MLGLQIGDATAQIITNIFARQSPPVNDFVGTLGFFHRLALPLDHKGVLPMAAQDDRSVANRLFFRLFQASNILQKQTASAVGLTTVQWAVLGALSRRGYERGIAFNDLVEYLIVSRQSLDGVLKRLEREGYVRRIPHPDDGRARLILLTEEGREYWNSLQPKIHDFYAQGLESLSFDETVSLLHYLNKFQRDLQQIEPIPEKDQATPAPNRATSGA